MVKKLIIKELAAAKKNGSKNIPLANIYRNEGQS